MVVRFSTVGGESGSPDEARDPRGFAMKWVDSVEHSAAGQLSFTAHRFRTRKGILDLVMNSECASPDGHSPMLSVLDQTPLCSLSVILPSFRISSTLVQELKHRW